MRWFGIVLVGLAILTSACGGGTSDEGAPDEGAAADPVRDAFEAQLEAALLRDLPLLEEEEAACISDAVLAVMADFETALDDPVFLAEEMLAGVQAAQERCLTPDRIAELEGDEALALTPEPAERAFLLVVRGVVEDLDTEDQELVGAGYLMCGLAEEAGSLDTLLARLAATPETSARVAADLLPSLGRVLEAEELITFSTMAVVALCPEVDDR
jgi:hypothetical protein